MSAATLDGKITEGLASQPTSIDLIEGLEKEWRVEADFKTATIIPHQEFDVEMEYGGTSFPVGEVKPLRANRSLKIGLTDAEGVVEIIGWGLQVDLREIQELPKHVGRRFLELYGKSLQGELTETEEVCFENICKDVDYRQFCQSREMPRYREATVIRDRARVFLEYLTDRIELSEALANQLRVLEDGQRFGAWFTVDDDGEIVGIRGVTPRPAIEDVDQALAEIPALTNDDVPDFILERLEKKRNG